MSTTATETDYEIMVLNELFNEDSKPCEYEECTENAAHMLKCPCGEGHESVCQEHGEQIRRMMESPYTSILFNNTCGHEPLLKDCKLLPI